MNTPELPDHTPQEPQAPFNFQFDIPPQAPLASEIAPPAPVGEVVKPIIIEKSKPNVSGFFLKTLFWACAVVFLLFASLLMTASFFQDKVTAQIIKQVNKELKTTLSVNRFDLSLLSNFPNAAAEMRSVQLNDAFGGKLLEAEKVAMHFNILSVLSSEIKIESVIIENGGIHIKIDKNGRSNYDITKPSTSKNKSTFIVALEKADFTNILLNYTNDQSNQKVRILLNNAALAGKFSADKFLLESSANFLSKYVKLPEYDIFLNKKLAYQGVFDVDLSRGLYQFKNVKLLLADNPIAVQGAVQLGTENSDFDLAMNGDEADLSSALQLLPPKYLSYFQDFKSEGTFLFKSTIRGRLNKTETPVVNLTCGLKNGTISSPKLERALTNVSFTTNFTHPTASFEIPAFKISDFKGNFEGNPVEMRLAVYNLNEPFIDFFLNGTIPLNSTFGLLNQPHITDGKGNIQVRQLALQGKYKDMLSSDKINTVKTSGHIEFDNATLVVNKNEVKVPTGSINLQNNNLAVNGFRLNIAGDNIVLDGSFNNLVPVLFADSLNANQTRLDFQSKLYADKLNIDKILAVLTPPEKPSENKDIAIKSVKKVKNSGKITDYLRGTFQANVNDFTYGKLRGDKFIGTLDFLENQELLVKGNLGEMQYEKVNGRNFNGTARFANDEMVVKGDVTAMEGTFNIDGKIFVNERNLRAKVVCKNVNMREFFRQFDNFDQTFLMDKHLRGMGDTYMALNVFWDENGKMQTDKLHALIDANISDGELLNFPMFESFAAFVKIEDLYKVKFTNLHNWIEIKDGRVYFPTMFIQSNALNLTMSGIHTFNNAFNYKLKVNAGQVLMSRFRKYNPSLNPQKAENGMLNIYYVINGTPSNFKFAMDKTEVKDDLERGNQKKVAIMEALEREFGMISAITAAPLGGKLPPPIAPLVPARDTTEQGRGF
jgi:AsmA-like C-terminal region